MHVTKNLKYRKHAELKMQQNKLIQEYGQMHRDDGCSVQEIEAEEEEPVSSTDRGRYH